MLTLESKFSEYVEALRNGGACKEVVSIHDAMLAKNPKLTVGDVYKTFCEDPKFNEGWACWALQLIGKEMDVSFRSSIIKDLIKDPMQSLQMLMKCDFLTEKEHMLLKNKYVGKLPTAEKEIADCKVVLKKAKALIS